MDRREFIAKLAVLPLLGGAAAAAAQSGPLTRIIFPFAAGGGGDALSRLIAQEIAPLLGRTVIVENRTGADGLIGIRAVKGAEPDGTTVLITTGPTMYLLPLVETKPSFDPQTDFVPVSKLVRFEFAVAVGKAVDAEVKDFRSFVAWLKAHPDKAVFGVPSNGTIPHFTGSQLEKVLGVSMTRVAYRGGAPIVTDLIGGHIPFAILTLTDAIEQHRAGGGVRVLAVTSAERSPFLPEAPTLKETGIDLVAEAWYGMWLPAKSSPDFARQLSEAVGKALARPEAKDRLMKIGLIPVGSTPDGLARDLAADTAFWQPIVAATGYKIAN